MRLIRVPRTMSMTRLIRLLAGARIDQAVLRIPWGARAFRDPVNLDLLALYARERHIELMLVSSDRGILHRGAGAGLRVASSLPVSLLDKGVEELVAAGREPPATRQPHLPAWLMACVLCLVLLGAMVLLWPRPTVVVSAAQQKMTLTARALISPAYRESQIPEGRLPANELNKTGLVAVEVAATGSRMVGVTPAQGQVTLLNETDERVVVPAGTAIESPDGRRYLTQEAVTAPAAQQNFLLGIKVGSVSGQVQAAVVADEPGSAGNLGPGKLTVIVGPLGRVLKVVNTKALSGGADQKVAVVTEEDVTRARVEAQRQLELKAPEELQDLAGTEQILFDELMSVTEGPAAEKPKAGEAGETVRVTLPYSVRCLAIRRTSLAKFLEDQANRHVPANFVVARQAFTVQGLVAVAKDPRTAEIQVTASYMAQGRLDRQRLFTALLGKKESEAREAILALPEVAAVQLSLAPGRKFPNRAWLVRLVFP